MLGRAKGGGGSAGAGSTRMRVRSAAEAETGAVLRGLGEIKDVLVDLRNRVERLESTPRRAKKPSLGAFVGAMSSSDLAACPSAARQR